ncbi:MAG: DNA-directed RNA polymerase subunit omega [Candidatus Methylomirabilales bacterium]
MSPVPIEQLIDKVDSKYRLVHIAAKRSRQLNRGSTPLIQSRGHKPTYVALDEVAVGKVEFSITAFDEETRAGMLGEGVKPVWFRDIAPEGVVEVEDEDEVVEIEADETEGEVEGAVPVSGAVEADLVDINVVEGAGKEEEEA